MTRVQILNETKCVSPRVNALWKGINPFLLLLSKLWANCRVDWACVKTALWMHHKDADITHREKGWRKLHKNAMSYIEQILEATIHETTAEWPLTSDLKTIQVRQTRHTGHCWRNKDELISDVFLWIPTYGRTSVGPPTKTCLHSHAQTLGAV